MRPTLTMMAGVVAVAAACGGTPRPPPGPPEPTLDEAAYVPTYVGFLHRTHACTSARDADACAERAIAEVAGTDNQANAPWPYATLYVACVDGRSQRACEASGALRARLAWHQEAFGGLPDDDVALERFAREMDERACLAGVAAGCARFDQARARDEEAVSAQERAKRIAEREERDATGRDFAAQAARDAEREEERRKLRAACENLHPGRCSDDGTYVPPVVATASTATSAGSGARGPAPDLLTATECEGAYQLICTRMMYAKHGEYGEQAIPGCMKTARDNGLLEACPRILCGHRFLACTMRPPDDDVERCFDLAEECGYR